MLFKTVVKKYNQMSKLTGVSPSTLKKEKIVMNKFIPLEKQTKKAQKAHNAMMRGSWFGMNPVTRTCPDKKKYQKAERSRAKAALRAEY